jgi:hypothetical protein
LVSILLAVNVWFNGPNVYSEKLRYRNIRSDEVEETIDSLKNSNENQAISENPLKVLREGDLIPEAEGFTPNLPSHKDKANYVCSERRTYSREATSLGSRLPEHPKNQNIPRENRAKYDLRLEDYNVIIKDSQAQKKFKPAVDFEVEGNLCRENIELFKQKIKDHIANLLTGYFLMRPTILM